MNMKASNDNIWVYIPALEEDVLGGLELSDSLREERAKEKMKDLPLEIHSVGSLVQDKTLVAGEYAVIQGTVLRMNHVPSDKPGKDLASIKAYSVIGNGKLVAKPSLIIS